MKKEVLRSFDMLKEQTRSTLSIFCVALICFTAISCSRDDEAPPPDPIIYDEEPCEEVWPITIFNQHTDTLNLSLAVARSDDPSEIIAYWAFKKKIVKLNMATRQAVTIVDNVTPFSTIKWGSSDWLLYKDFQEGLLKVKSNGDSLTFITLAGGAAYDWNPNGNKYMYTESAGGVPGFIVRNRHDQIVDTLSRLFQESINWVSDNVVWYSKGYFLIEEDSVVNLAGFGTGFVAAVDEMTAYSNSMDGLVLMDRFTQDVEVIREPYQSCDYIREISFNQAKNKLLATRLRRVMLPDGRSTFTIAELVWLNLDGSIHEVIDHRSMLESL